MIRCTHHAPRMAHIDVIACPPESIIHRKAIQGGVVTIKGDIKSPFNEYGVQITGYAFEAA